MSLIETKADIQAKISKRELWDLRSLLNDRDPQEIAQLIDDLPAPDDVIVFRLLSFTLATDAFELLSREKQE